MALQQQASLGPVNVDEFRLNGAPAMPFRQATLGCAHRHFWRCNYPKTSKD
jgi:hypothetical protein